MEFGLTVTILLKFLVAQSKRYCDQLVNKRHFLNILSSRSYLNENNYIYGINRYALFH